MNIEKTISEHAVSDILTPMLESQDRIVTEDVAPLFDAATGLDTPPASGTVTTTIEESRSVIIAIIRKAWTAPMTMLGGASVISYIAAAYTYLRNRLQGSETYGIPDRRSEISASSPLAANLALLNDRKIGGESPIPDGISVYSLLCNTTACNLVTEINDSNRGWIWNRKTLADILALFPSATKATLGCGQAIGNIIRGSHSLTDLVLPVMTYIEGLFDVNLANGKISAPELVEMNLNGGNIGMVGPYGKELNFPKCRKIYGYSRFWQSIDNLLVEKMVWGSIDNFGIGTWNWWEGKLTKLKHLEFGADGLGGLSVSMNLALWEPDSTILDGGDNQALFLSNFREFIANRLTDNGSGKTLTLSQAVFSEIWDSNGNPQVKGDGLDELRADIHRIIRTVKQWAVNKA